jgi:hypothetical protein
VHTLAQKHNLKHQSSGKGDERFITVYKRTHVPSAEAARMNEHAVEEQVQLRDCISDDCISEGRRGAGAVAMIAH